MNTKTATIESRIRLYWDELSVQEQQLADIILSAPGELATHTATELAISANVSKATTTRFFRHLGYENYEEARKQARNMQKSGAPLYLQQLKSPSPLREQIQVHLEQEIANLVSTYQSLDSQELDEVIRALSQARTIAVLGWRHSQTIANLLYRNLVHIHPRALLLPKPGDSLGEYLATLGPRDVAICVGLRRRMPALSNAMKALEKLQVPVLYISEVFSGKPAKQARWVIRCNTEGHLIFDSTVALSGICNLLCSLVAKELGKTATEQLNLIESLHESLEELE